MELLTHNGEHHEIGDGGRLIMMMVTNSTLRRPKRTPDQPSRESLGLGGGSVSGSLGYIGIYRRKEYVGGATGGPTRVEGAPPTSCPPGCFLDVGSKSSGSCSFQKSRSRRFHSVWTPFDIPFLRNSELGKKQQFWAGPPVNRLVPKII